MLFPFHVAITAHYKVTPGEALGIITGTGRASCSWVKNYLERIVVIKRYLTTTSYQTI